MAEQECTPRLGIQEGVIFLCWNGMKGVEMSQSEERIKFLHCFGDQDDVLHFVVHLLAGNFALLCLEDYFGRRV